MEQLLFSLNATIPVFLVMVIGYVLQQLHVTNDSFVKTLNSFNYKITLPVLLFKDMSTADFYSVWDTGYVLFCFFVTLFCIVITWVVAGIFYKNKSRLGELVQASYRSSAAVLGIAFIQNIYGNSGMAPLMIVGTVPLYNIAAVLILSFTGPDAKGFDKKSLMKSLKGIITNPIIISIALGMLSSACRISYPVIISKTISNIAVLATPLALIGLGAGFEGKKALKLLAPTGVATVLKLVIWPALFLPLAVYFGFTGEKLVAILIMLGSPTTVSCYIMAKNMKYDGDFTSGVVMTTTLLSSFTMTIWLYICRSLGLI